MDLKKVDTEDLIQELQDRGFLRILWCREDVKEMIEKSGYDYTEKDVLDIMNAVVRHHDCEIGMNWTVIETHIDMHFWDKRQSNES